RGAGGTGTWAAAAARGGGPDRRRGRGGRAGCGDSSAASRTKNTSYLSTWNRLLKSSVQTRQSRRAPIVVDASTRRASFKRPGSLATRTQLDELPSGSAPASSIP